MMPIKPFGRGRAVRGVAEQAEQNPSLFASPQAPTTVMLIGAPNIGKSALFNHLTGMEVRVANYAGTTVDCSIGEIQFAHKTVLLVDVPGTYSLQATCEAERVAVGMLAGEYDPSRRVSAHCENCPQKRAGAARFLTAQRPDLAVCVLDAGNLESSLHLFFEVRETGLPTIAVLNRVDLAEDRGLSVDTSRLSVLLAAPVVPTVAVKAEGIDELRSLIEHSLEPGGLTAQDAAGEVPALDGCTDTYSLWEQHWEQAAQIVAEVVQELGQSDTHEAVGNAGRGGTGPGARSSTAQRIERAGRRRRLGRALAQPWPGLPAALLVLALTFGFIVGAGMGVRRYLLLPFARQGLFPFLSAGVAAVVPPGLLQNILIGEYGFLIKGIEWPFTLVLPYVISFYFAMSFLEDSGYLPRLGVLLDGLLNRMGMQGSSVIPLMLGYGCGIPAIMATRALPSAKERLLLTIMVCLAVPCISQTGAFIALLGAHSLGVMLGVFLLGAGVLVLTGVVFDLLTGREQRLTVIEIPELLVPGRKVILKKVWMRFKHYLLDGAVPMMIGIGIAAVVYETGAIASLGVFMAPVVQGWLRLPAEAAVPLLLGIVRRELTVLPLMDMELSTLQLFVGASVGLFYVPCVAVVVAVAREFNLKVALAVLVGTTGFALGIGGIIARVGGLLF